MDIETIAEVLELLNASNTPRVMDRVSPVYGVHFAVCTAHVQSVLQIVCITHTTANGLHYNTTFGHPLRLLG